MLAIINILSCIIISISDVKEKTSAATKIQALWRGFLVRHKEGHVTRALREIRTRRSEEHIRHLLSEVERCVCVFVCVR